MTSEHHRPAVAAIDIGSNSIKMTVARPDGAGGIDQFDWASEIVRLGHGLDRTGRLEEERIEIAIETLHRFAARARELGATQVLAVATEATRVAANGSAFIDRIREETGISVRVVDGNEEAALTFRGLTATTDISGSLVIADIGGASTELIVARDGAMQVAQSIPLGSGRLTERVIEADPPSAAEIIASEAFAASAVAAVAKSLRLPVGSGTRLIVVGGTGEFMARLVPDETNISLATVRRVLARLEALTAAELAAEIDIPVARARVLPAGVAIVAAIAERMKPDRVEISRSGIRAGLLLEAFQAGNGIGGMPDNAPEKPNGRKTRPVRDDKPPDVAAGFRDAMKTLIAERWTAVWKAIPAALEGTDSEGVHDVRVASRRLRAAMDIAVPVFPRGWFKSLHRTAKEITGALGEVRDRDVLLEALQTARESAPLAEHPGIDRLMDRVERERADARVEMERYLRELLDGPVRGRVERRFGPAAGRPEAPHAQDEVRL